MKLKNRLRSKFIKILLLAITLICVCCKSKPDTESTKSGKIIFTSTTIIKDIVYRIVGDEHEVHALLPIQASPHNFKPTPRDLAMLSKADILFINGLGLENFIDDVIRNALEKEKIISLSRGITRRYIEAEAANQIHGEDDHHHNHADPHVWMDPENVKIWVQTILDVMIRADSLNQLTYENRAAEYLAELTQLDVWIRQHISSIPISRTKIISDHLIFGYFCDKYNIEQVGAIIPSFSSLAEPSAKDLAALQDIIKSQGVSAVFVGSTLNPVLAEQIAKDTGIKLVSIHTGSLGQQGSGAESYIDYMKYNVQHIVNALNANN